MGTVAANTGVAARFGGHREREETSGETTLLDPSLEYGHETSGQEYRQYIPAGDRGRRAQHADH
jgi:hypothetical protein